jgi:hypothetical protein
MDNKLIVETYEEAKAHAQNKKNTSSVICGMDW